MLYYYFTALEIKILNAKTHLTCLLYVIATDDHEFLGVLRKLPDQVFHAKSHKNIIPKVP